MTARTSMADLITRLRTIVGDPETDPVGREAFDDDSVQAFLDERRTDVVEAQMRTRPSFSDSSLIVYHDYFAPRLWWEDSVVLHDTHGTVLTPTTSDLVAGHWTFVAGQAQPVYITGSFYDIYGSAQALCEAWAAKVAREFDFATDQQTFDRTGKREGLLMVAREFARKARQPGARPAWRSADW